MKNNPKNGIQYTTSELEEMEEDQKDEDDEQ